MSFVVLCKASAEKTNVLLVGHILEHGNIRIRCFSRQQIALRGESPVVEASRRFAGGERGSGVEQTGLPSAGEAEQVGRG